MISNAASLCALTLLVAACAGEPSRPAPSISYSGACSPCQTNADCRIKFADDDLLCYGLPDWGAGVGLCAHLRQDLPLCAQNDDGGAADARTDAEAKVQARGTFTSEAPGYSAAGEVELRVVVAGGQREVHFGPGFGFSPQLPGIRVVLTSRVDIGTALDPKLGDLDLGDLKDFAGQQVYPVTGLWDLQSVVWLFSPDQSRGLARAILSP